VKVIKILIEFFTTDAFSLQLVLILLLFHCHFHFYGHLAYAVRIYSYKQQQNNKLFGICSVLRVCMMVDYLAYIGSSVKIIFTGHDHCTETVINVNISVKTVQ